MGYIKGTDRNQVTLFPDSIDEYIEADSYVRVIDAFVESLDIAKIGFGKCADEGRPGYDPKDLCKLYIYGYIRVYSDNYGEYEFSYSLNSNFTDN